MLRKVATGTRSRLTTVDHTETYGRHILDQILKDLRVDACLDIGCGEGADLEIVRKHNPDARLIGVDFGNWNKDLLSAKGVDVVSVNIECERLPFPDNSIDFVIANQVMEHTKEVFWINHEIFRVLREGGFLFLGVPNVLSFHNRVLGLLGIHPTSSKMLSAHVRPFSKGDTILYYKEVGGGCVALEKFYGAQFYPFGRRLARFFSRVFPTLSFSIFFLFRKTNPYANQFVKHLDHTVLETNFFKGEPSAGHGVSCPKSKD